MFQPGNCNHLLSPLNRLTPPIRNTSLKARFFLQPLVGKYSKNRRFSLRLILIGFNYRKRAFDCRIFNTGSCPRVLKLSFLLAFKSQQDIPSPVEESENWLPWKHLENSRCFEKVFFDKFSKTQNTVTSNRFFENSIR